MFMTGKLARVVVLVLAATASQALVAGEPTKKQAAKPRVKQAAKPVVPVVVIPKSPITISIKSRMRHGNLVVSLDGVPVFNEEFQKPVYLISQTTTWDPLQVAAGKHRLTAKVHGKNGKTYVSGSYDLDVSRTKGIDLLIRLKGDTLMVEPVS